MSIPMDGSEIPFSPGDEHALNLQLRRLREKSLDSLERTLEATVRIFGNVEMAEKIAKMSKVQYDAYRMAGFTEDQSMALLLRIKEPMR